MSALGAVRHIGDWSGGGLIAFIEFLGLVPEGFAPAFAKMFAGACALRHMVTSTWRVELVRLVIRLLKC